MVLILVSQSGSNLHRGLAYARPQQVTANAPSAVETLVTSGDTVLNRTTISSFYH